MQTSELLLARISDALNICAKRQIPKFVGFVELQTAEEQQKLLNGSKYMLWGGYEAAARVFVGVFPDWAEPNGNAFPIDRLAIVNKSSQAFTHRDVLGALMSCGIERDTVGDILITENKTVVFVEKSVTKHLLGQITKIKNCGVEIYIDNEDFAAPQQSFKEMRQTIASNRLDCVVSQLVSKSRNTAAELIHSKMVAVNGNVTEKLTAEISPQDKITVRGYGKFIIDDITSRTAKGRLVIVYKKYS